MTEQTRKGARETALIILHQVDTQNSYANELLDQIMQKENPEPRERRLITELVYGTLRMQGALDWILNQVSRHPVDSMPSYLRCILRLGAYQLMYLVKIPHSAAVNESVNLGRKFGHKGWVTLINGILRALIRKKNKIQWPDPEEDPALSISTIYSHPLWIVQRWVDRWGVEETRALCEANNQSPPVVARANRLRVTRDELARLLAAEGEETEPGDYAPESLRFIQPASIRSLTAFQEGLFTVQDEASMLVSHILDVRPDHVVVDTCSAPGGKTTHMAELMDNRGLIYASDIHAGKLKLLAKSCQRLGITNVRLLVQDASQPFLDIPFHSADRVLVDAPCSGMGVLRRRADARWRKTPEQITLLSELQQRILTSAAALVKPGGVLVYSTCSTEPEENEKQVQHFLDRRPEFCLSTLVPWLPASLQAEKTAESGYIQLLPHKHGTDGFFAARLVRQH